jgi:hypothetical protein
MALGFVCGRALPPAAVDFGLALDFEFAKLEIKTKSRIMDKNTPTASSETADGGAHSTHLRTYTVPLYWR